METIYELNSFGDKYYLIIEGARSFYISYEKVKEFGERLGSHLGFDVLSERKDSRVVLLGEDSKKCKIK